MPLKLTIENVDGTPGCVYYPLKLSKVPKPSPGPNEYLVKIHAAALNHRDFFIRQHLYPGISFENAMLSDGSGVVIETGVDANRSLLGQSVLLTSSRGWENSADGPEDQAKFANIGATKLYPLGTAQEYIVVHESEVEPAPEHLSAAEAAALPLVGLTAWRTLVTKSGNAVPGRNILITGIGGGVASQTLQFAVAMGCNVWVTSGHESKIRRAERMGARGGVSYRNEAWERELMGLLPEDRPFIDAIVDGTGGDIVQKGVTILKPGGVICCYGMTLSPKMDWLMQAVLKNIELKGTSAGSRLEFRDMVRFVQEKRIRPVVSRVVQGLGNLEEIDGLFEEMRQGKQFGKLVIEIAPEEEAKL